VQNTAAYVNPRKPTRTAAGMARAWHWAEVAPLVWPGTTLPLELEVVFVASAPVTAVAVTLGREAVVPAADVTTFLVDVTLRDVEETKGVTVAAVVAPPDEVLTVIGGMLKAGQASSKAFRHVKSELHVKRLDETRTADQFVLRVEQLWSWLFCVEAVQAG